MSDRNVRPGGRPDRLAEALRGVFATRRRPAPPPGDLPARLGAVERDLKEVRTRINALFFTVLTAVIIDLVGRAVL